MDIRKDDTERAVNLLKFYKSKLNKSDEKSLRKAMDKLIETLEAPLFTALLDIQEFYEVSLSTAIDGNQPKSQQIVEEIHHEVQQESPTRLKKERSKKSKRRQKSEEDDEPNEVEIQRSPKDNSAGQVSPSKTHQDYSDSKQAYKQEEYELQEDDSNNPWLCMEIDLVKSKKGYGFAVAGGYNKPHYEGHNGIFVTKIIPEGAAEVDGRLRIDDVIVSVNDVNLEHVTHETAVETLKTAGQNMILIINRLKDDYYANEHANVEEAQPTSSSNAAYYSSEQEAYQEESGEAQNFQQFEVTLIKRAGGGLGISIQGGYDPDNHQDDSYISISKLTPGGVADSDGRLQVGDFILQVDDQPLNGVTHDEAVNLMKNTGKQVTLYVGRFVEMSQDLDQEPEEQPIVEKTEKKRKKKHRRDREE